MSTFFPGGLFNVSSMVSPSMMLKEKRLKEAKTHSDKLQRELSRDRMNLERKEKQLLQECKRLATKGDLTGARLVASQIAKFRKLHDRNLESSIMIGTKAQAMASDHKVNRAEVETIKGFSYANMFESFNRLESREQRYAWRMGAISHIDNSMRETMDEVYRQGSEEDGLGKFEPQNDESANVQFYENEIQAILGQAINNGKPTKITTGSTFNVSAPFKINIKSIHDPNVGIQLILNPIRNLADASFSGDFTTASITVDQLKRKIVEDSFNAGQLNLFYSNGLSIKPFQLGKINKTTMEFIVFEFSDTLQELNVKNGDQLYVKVMSSEEEDDFLQQRINRIKAVDKLVSQQTPDAIRNLFKTLNEGKDKVTLDIQKNVHEHYLEFIEISQEISQLDKEVFHIRELLNEIRPQMENDFSSQIDTNEQQMLSSEMGFKSEDSLFKEQVEGLESVLDGSVARKLIKEGSGLAQLHPDDYKLGKPIYFLLYNNLLVIAYKKKKGYAKQKLVAEKFISLFDITLKDMKDLGANIINQFQIKSKEEELTIRCETLEVKKNWMQAINKTIDDLSKKGDYKNAEGIELPSYSLFSSLTDLSVADGHPNHREDVTNPELAWIHDMPDELDVLIAHREFDKAGQCIDRAKGIFNNYGTFNASMVLLKKNFDIKISNLANQLIKTISNPNTAPAQIHQAVNRLSRLGLGSKARDLFLHSRSQVIRSKLKTLPFEGDASTFIHDFTFLFFTLFKKSILLYKKYFSTTHSNYSTELTSGFVHWLRSEIKWYLLQFRILVFQAPNSFETIRECISSALDCCTLLKEIGVDLAYVFESGMRTDVEGSLEMYFTNLKAKFAKSMADDEFFKLFAIGELNFTSLDENKEDNKTLLAPYSVTSSAHVFTISIIQALFLDLAPLLLPGSSSSHAYYTSITKNVTSLIELYIRHLMDSLHETSMNIRQKMFILIDLYYLSDHLLPTLLKILENGCLVPISDLVKFSNIGNSKLIMALKIIQTEDPHIGFNRPIPEWSKLLSRISSMKEIATSVIVLQASRNIASNSFAFGPISIGKDEFIDQCKDAYFMDYSSEAYPVVELLLPNDSMIRCVKAFSNLEKSFEDIIDSWKNLLPSSYQTNVPIDKKILINGIIECFIKDISHERNWTTSAQYNRIIGFSGLHQYMLDIHYFLKKVDYYLTPKTLKLAFETCSKAFRVYFSRCNETEKQRVVKPSEWYEARVADSLKKDGGIRLGPPKK